MLALPPLKYKLGLIKTLIDRAYKINNTTQGFHNDIKYLSEILQHNMFPKWLIDKSVLKGILVRLQQQERTLLNVKYPTATSTSYLISVIIIQQIVTLSKYGHDALDIRHP